MIDLPSIKSICVIRMEILIQHFEKPVKLWSAMFRRRFMTMPIMKECRINKQR